MTDWISWNDVYALWNRESYYFPDTLEKSACVDNVFVKCDSDGFIFGYDWLLNEEAINRKKMIEKNPLEFLYFTKPTNKGTIQTAQMLSEAESSEERAAIWIAATAFELMDRKVRNSIARNAQLLYYSALDFLKDRYMLWHGAMRKLVPNIMIPYPVLDSMKCDSSEIIMNLIQTNVMLLKGSYTILQYSSLSDADIQREKKEGRLTFRR